jgi:hypothetical protein
MFLTGIGGSPAKGGTGGWTRPGVILQTKIADLIKRSEIRSHGNDDFVEV